MSLSEFFGCAVILLCIVFISGWYVVSIYNWGRTGQRPKPIQSIVDTIREARAEAADEETVDPEAEGRPRKPQRF